MATVLNLVPKIQEKQEKEAKTLPATLVLKESEGLFEDVLVLGWHKDGGLAWNMTDSIKRRKDLLELIELFKTRLLEK